MLAKTLKALLLLCLIQAARTVADPVKGRAPGSSEQLHRSGERKHGRSAPLNASPLKQPPLGSVGQLLRPALPSPRRQERDDKGRALGVGRCRSCISERGEWTSLDSVGLRFRPYSPSA